jgi:hypothetical protein
MLREESITAVSQPPTARATTDCDLLPGTETLIEEIRQRLLAGQSINNRALTEIADRAYGGSRARGTYTARDAYDATETAVNKLLETGQVRHELRSADSYHRQDRPDARRQLGAAA